jgi:hypothetical protein
MTKSVVNRDSNLSGLVLRFRIAFNWVVACLSGALASWFIALWLMNRPKVPILPAFALLAISVIACRLALQLQKRYRQR